MTYGEARGKFGKPAIEECLNQFDGKLPDEIISKSTEEQCGLCEVSFKQGAPDGSRVTYSYKMALSHYAGKSHMKKLKVELQAWHEKDPATNIVPKIKEIQASPVKAGGPGGEEQDQNYCHTCKIPLTSPSVAQSHYTGKPHQKQVQKRVREGTYFVEKEAFPEHVRKRQADGKMAVPVEGFPDSIKKPRTVSINQFRCDICNVETTDQGGLDMHLAGKKHIKKAAQAGSEFLSSLSF